MPEFFRGETIRSSHRERRMVSPTIPSWNQINVFLRGLAPLKGAPAAKWLSDSVPLLEKNK